MDEKRNKGIPMKIFFSLLALISIFYTIKAYRRAIINESLATGHARAHRLIMERHQIQLAPATDKKASDLIEWNKQMMLYADNVKIAEKNNADEFSLRLIKASDEKMV
jgi:hypothetical protein